MAAYSFADVTASITGPGGNFSIGAGAGIASEGITIEWTAESNVMTKGADRSTLHTFVADNSATITVRLLKNSPTNGQLQAMFDLQSSEAALWGSNVIYISSKSLGEIHTATDVAFTKRPNSGFAKEPDMYEWIFHAGEVTSIY